MNPSIELNGLDYDAALERLGGDVDLLREIAAIALVECPQILEQIRLELIAGNADAVQCASHTMKDAVSSVGALDAYIWANQLERDARAGDLLGATLSLDNLATALKNVRPAWLALAEPSAVTSS